MVFERSKTEPRSARRSAPAARRRPVIAVLLMALGLLILLALVSYDAMDEISTDVGFADLVNVFSGDPVAKAKADTARNWLGLVGAVIADFFILSTIGFASLCFPFLLIMWGWAVLKSDGINIATTVSSYVLIGGLLVSSSFGMVRLIFGNDSLTMAWSGVIGDFLASTLAQLLGKAGGSIVLLCGIVVTAILAFDLDVLRFLHSVRTLFLRLLDGAGRVKARWSERRESLNDRHESRDDELTAAIRIHRPETIEDEQVPARRREAIIKRTPAEVIEQRLHRQPPAGVEQSSDLKVESSRARPERDGDADKRGTGTHVDGHLEEIDYVFPSVDLLDASRHAGEEIDEHELKGNADLLRETLAEFNVELESVSVTPGPVITLYELVPASGVKISSIVSLENDIALKLAAKGIRIMAPIPGKSAVGVEIPNHHRMLVTIRSVINSSRFREFRGVLPLAMGKTISGDVFVDDLSRMPHLLIAGSTGSGKSVGINTILTSLLYRMHPSDLKLVIVDPKKIELAQFARLRNHFLAVSPDVDEEIITTPRNAVQVLKGVEIEMERRYDRLASAGVRNIQDYNGRLASGRLKNTETVVHARISYLLVVIDELADLMITAAREVEEPIARLAQLARAVGIHLIVATQRPSVDVITGVIKANFPARIAYQVSSKTDSRTILDMNGAEQLLGNGDMLYLAAGSPKPIRLQNAYISTDEVETIMDHIGGQKGYSHPFMLPSLAEKKRAAATGEGDDRDELFEEAARLIVRHQQGSVSLLQRRLKVGYSRAARLVDELEMAGIVGPFDGSKAREVLVESEEELQTILGGP